jgi:hypothetical protein
VVPGGPVIRSGMHRPLGPNPVRPGYAPKVRCGAGVTGLCAGWSDAGVGAVDFAPVGRRIPTPNGYFSPLDYKYPFTYLERIRLSFKSYHYLLSLSLSLSLALSPPLMSSPIFHSTQPNPKSFGRKIEETPIYISTKLNFISPCVHRVLLVTLGFVGNPRRLGSPEGIRLVICPMESL